MPQCYTSTRASPAAGSGNRDVSPRPRRRHPCRRPRASRTSRGNRTGRPVPRVGQRGTGPDARRVPRLCPKRSRNCADRPLGHLWRGCRTCERARVLLAALRDLQWRRRRFMIAISGDWRGVRDDAHHDGAVERVRGRGRANGRRARRRRLARSRRRGGSVPRARPRSPTAAAEAAASSLPGVEAAVPRRSTRAPAIDTSEMTSRT